MPILRIAVGRREEATQLETLKAFLSEFLATFIFIFAGQGSEMAYSKLTNGAPTTPEGLVAISMAYGLALIAAVSVGANNSGGHVNPAVTFGAFVGGNITLLRGLIYWVAQLLGSAFACLLLELATGGLSPAVPSLSGISATSGVIFEAVMTFGLVYTVYATAVDPRKGGLGTIAPIAIGVIVSANILAGGPFSGGAMNPAGSFGPALVSWNWAGHWVYWTGPLIGGGLAGVAYDFLFVSQTHEHLPRTAADY